MRLPTRVLVGSVALASALLLTGCGGSSSPAESAATPGATSGSSTGASTDGAAAPDSAAPTSIKVAETAGIPSSFLEYGKSKGFFTKHGLDLQIDTSVGGAAVVPALVSGNIQVGGSNTVSVLLAASKGLPLTMIASGTFATETPDKDFSAVLAGKNSGITKPADLAGKKIAVNTLKNIGDVTIKASLAKLGVDISQIKFVEAGFPDMLALLAKGDVDAAWEIEPFVTIGRAQGFTPVLWPYVAAKPGLMVGSFVTSADYAKAHPDVIEAFRAGVKETAAAVAQDPQAFRDAMPTISKTKAEVAQKIVLPVWKGDVDTASLTWLAEQMKTYGLVDSPVDVTKVVAAGAAG